MSSRAVSCSGLKVPRLYKVCFAKFASRALRSTQGFGSLIANGSIWFALASCSDHFGGLASPESRNDEFPSVQHREAPGIPPCIMPFWRRSIIQPHPPSCSIHLMMSQEMKHHVNHIHLSSQTYTIYTCIYMDACTLTHRFILGQRLPNKEAGSHNSTLDSATQIRNASWQRNRGSQAWS